MQPPGVRRTVDANGVETIEMEIMPADRPPPAPWSPQVLQLGDDYEPDPPAQQVG
jgi:hypothetical protein